MNETAVFQINPWISIWTKPRATIRSIISWNPAYGVIAISVLAGINSALSRASLKNLGDSIDITVIFVIAFLLGPVGGLITLYFAAWLLRIAGSMLGGGAESLELRAAFAWAQVPQVVGMLLWIPELLFFGREMFTSATPLIDASPFLQVGLVLFGAGELVFAFWSLILMAKTIGAVQEFSAWRALASMILAGLLFFVPILLLVGALILIF